MNYKMNYDEWLNSNELSDADIAILKALDEESIKDMFYAPLSFGTAGMRGIIDLGPNRMNIYTVKRATIGLAKFLISKGKKAMNCGVVISYDTRKFSKEFAIISAVTLAKFKIKVYLFEDVRPVPFCSFAIRTLNAFSGIMITASHNPKQYNGYKIYGDDGAQMGLESTKKVVKYIDSTKFFNELPIQSDELFSHNDIKNNEGKLFHEYITIIGKDIDDKYFNEIENLSLSKESIKKYGKDIKVVYTPIHGTGYMPVTTILERMGISINTVTEQCTPDPNFSTVPVPNPEDANALKIGIELAKKIDSDIVIGTDPDADRMGIAIRNSADEFVLLNGNQIGCLLVSYILERLHDTKKLPANAAIIKTIVTTDLAAKIAKAYNVTCFDVLTGFKFIGEKIKDWEKNSKFTYIFGFEESYGSLIGTHSRDKDAVVAAMMFAEMMCYLKSKNISISDYINSIFEKFGFYIEKSISIGFSGIDGMQKMNDIMKLLRDTNFETIGSIKVKSKEDYLLGTALIDGKKKKLKLPKSNVIKIILENEDWVCIRPSGTEPKLKIYASAKRNDMNSAEHACENYLTHLKSFIAKK